MSTPAPDGTRLFETFAEALRAVSGHPHLVSNAQEAARIVARILEDAKATRIATAQLPRQLQELVEEHCRDREIELLQDPFDEKSVLDELDGAHVGIAGAAFGIAETGTLVEVTTDDAHRLVSSLPRTYIGVVDAREMVGTLREAAGRLGRIFSENPDSLAISFISGPSRTGDIELILTLGVHGPEVAHAIVITGEPHA